MTEAELREKIKEILYRHGMYSPTTEAQYWQEKLLEEFGNLFTEAMKGYVKLAEDQTPPKNAKFGFGLMLDAGFRRVELEVE